MPPPTTRKCWVARRTSWAYGSSVRKSTRAARDHLAGGDEFKRYLQDVDVLITICFLAVYVTKEMFRKAPNLKLIVTVEGVQISAFYHKRLTGSRV